MFGPNHEPRDGLTDRLAHDIGVQAYRSNFPVDVGPRGGLLDYVAFYFGVLSPMLLRLATNRVEGYAEGQAPIIHLVSDAQSVANSNLGFVFSDGQANKATTERFANLDKLSRIDWKLVNEQYWRDTAEDPDRMRRKQAEFLVHKFFPFGLITEIGVFDAKTKAHVEKLLVRSGRSGPVVRVRADWYYPGK
jgi:hypothetical protein